MRLRWGRILLAGLFSELTIFAIFLPIQAANPQAAVNVVPVLVTVTAFLWGWWAARRAGGRYVAHGVLAAVAASLMWIGLVSAGGGNWSEIPLLYHLSHGLRLLGGAGGGMWAARRAVQEAPPQMT